LSAANNVNGTTYVNGGTLQYNDAAVGSIQGNVIIAGGATNIISVSTGTQSQGASYTISGAGTLAVTGAGLWKLGSSTPTYVSMSSGGQINLEGTVTPSRAATGTIAWRQIWPPLISPPGPRLTCKWTMTSWTP